MGGREPRTGLADDLGSVLVVIPTYNEVENLPGVLGRVRACVPTAHVLIVDDASPDGTGQVADELAHVDGQVDVLHRPGKAGLGAAYIAGFALARENGFDVVVEMDADGSHAPEELPRLLVALRGADLVLGSRYVPGGTVVNWPRSRLLLSRAGNVYARLLLRLPVHDATGGYRAYRRPMLDSLRLETVASQGYCFQVDLVRRAWGQGFRVVEVPITFTERTRGSSKMSRFIVFEALWRIGLWGLRSWRAALLGRRRSVR